MKTLISIQFRWNKKILTNLAKRPTKEYLKDGNTVKREKIMLYRIEPKKMPQGVTDRAIWARMWANGVLELPEGMTQEEVSEKLTVGDPEFLEKYSKQVGELAIP